MGRTNDGDDAWEALIIDASRRVKNPTDNDFMVLALGDTNEEYAHNVMNAINAGNPEWKPVAAPKEPVAKTHFVFRGRILGENSPHAWKPMPCFDYVRETAGWFQTAPGAEDAAKNAAKIFNQNLVAVHAQFYIPKKKGRKPRLGDVFRARLAFDKNGWQDKYSLSLGTAVEFISNDLFRVENWEKDAGNNQKFYYTTTKKSCDSLADLFEEKAIESEQIEECGELCCITADDWHTFEKTNHPVWKTFGPTATTGGGKYRLKTKPCEGYVVKRPESLDQQFNKLTDIVKREIDWWACGDVKKAWGSKMDSTTLAEFDIEPAGGWDNTRSEKCSGIRKEPWDAAAGGLSDRIEAYELELSKTWNVNLEDIDASPHATDIPAFFVGQLEDDRLLKYFKKTWNRWKKDLPTDEDTNWTTAYIPERWVLEKENHWSAITVSWLLLEVDPTFPAAAAHTTYVFRTMGFALSTQKAPSSTYSPATHGWTAWVRGSTTPRIVAQLGDVLWKPRAGKTITDSHADVVSRIAKHDKKTYAYLAGGNISDTMVGWRTTTSAGGRIKLNDDGTYPPASGASDYQIVLKKDGRIVPAEKTPAVAEVTPGTGDTGL